ncbi:MAG: hypothetical protein EA382_18115 [Spirochaetaceae bacterium]|nr:MAG: hypothetical protein EA382_18115 [Spirochaetaceae bacterium]
MAQIVVEVGKDSAAVLDRSLAELGIGEYVSQVARSVVGHETSGLVSILKPVALEQDPLAVITCVVPIDRAQTVAAHIAKSLDLATPGQGTMKVYSVSVGTPSEPEDPIDAETVPSSTASSVLLLDNVAEIVSIVQRGEGTSMSSFALNLGQSVPSVTFGIGMGLREKLNLIRITFPRDKEIVRITVNADEAQDVFDQLVDVGRLDEPGKGFIYLSPIKRALPNTLLFRGSQRHAATMEQVIQAIDSMQGTASWRQKRIATVLSGGSRRKYLQDMDEIEVRIADGHSQQLVLAAMPAGAAGATISRARLVRVHGSERTGAGVEILYIIVPASVTHRILTALEDAGLWADKLNGGVTVRPVQKACTYLS